MPPTTDQLPARQIEKVSKVDIAELAPEQARTRLQVLLSCGAWALPLWRLYGFAPLVDVGGR
jgi:hypothetical protein